MSGELLELPHGVMGMALNLEEDASAPCSSARPTSSRRATGPAHAQDHAGAGGRGVIGRVVNTLGQPLDGKGPIPTTHFMPVERSRPGVVDGTPVKEPLQTGIKAIDAMIPIGRGQRELIIGDRQTGKTAIASTRSSTRRARASSASTWPSARSSRRRAGRADAREPTRMAYTIVVAGGRVDPARFSTWRPTRVARWGSTSSSTGRTASPASKGNPGARVLCIYDDSRSTRSSYREVSLLLRRPPGREAYPGDVFYLHSRLLERASKLNAKTAAGSITALPIIETQAGDISAYIPTNVISITDGQIFLESDLFYSGVRPR
jgi:F-type H+-transporting ATPase subunit alpha